MARETELKYTTCDGFSSDLLFSDRLIAPYCSELNKLEMHTEYLDTLDGDAKKQGVTLRRRFENGESVIYAKCGKGSSGALSVRGEWSVKSGDIKNAAELLSYVGAPTSKLVGLPLITVASVHFVRCECLVSPYDGFSFMLSFDDGYFGENTHFCEVELELRQGSAEELVIFGEKLAESLGFVPETRSKYARAIMANQSSVL